MFVVVLDGGMGERARAKRAEGEGSRKGDGDGEGERKVRPVLGVGCAGGLARRKCDARQVRVVVRLVQSSSGLVSTSNSHFGFGVSYEVSYYFVLLLFLGPGQVRSSGHATEGRNNCSHTKRGGVRRRKQGKETTKGERRKEGERGCVGKH